MKKYQEAIDHIAKRMWHQHMGGGWKSNALSGADNVAFIYEVAYEKVIEDAEAGFRKLNGGLD